VPRWDYAKLPPFIETNLPAYAQKIIDQVSNRAEARNLRAYLVGGGAREVMRAFVDQISTDNLQHFVFDIDIAVEGDAIALAEALAEEYGGAVIRNDRFHTAKWIGDSGYGVDLTMCRREHYPIPGKLPEVLGQAEIYEDLLRRDFSFNALGISISKEDFGTIYDPTGAVGDIFGKTLRVLHPQSFFEDPTRMLRAIRYSIRLNYRIDEETALLFAQGLEESYFDQLSPERVRYELECVLSEDFWFGILWAAYTSDLPASLHPEWNQLPTVSGSDAEVLELGIRNQEELLEQDMVPQWLVRLSWSLVNVRVGALPNVLKRIGVHSRLAQSMAEAREKFDEVEARMNHAGFKPSRIYRVCQEYPRKTLLFISFNSYLVKDTEPLRTNLMKHLREFSPKRNVLPGERLIGLGLPAGPLVGKAQEELWWRKIDGELPDDEATEKAARELIERYLSQPIV
jgi:tRNA nucleotidyltransferase (CCA-adding enzyme)